MAERGFTLVELLVVATVLGLLMAGAVGVLRTHSVTYTQQELSVALEDNLRLGMTSIRDELRRAGYGVPTQSLPSWIDWTGRTFNGNPLIVPGSGTNPDQVLIAACTSRPVARLNADAAVGTALSVDTPSAFNATNRRLLRLGDSEFARVMSVSGNTLTIDTDPVTANNQPLSRAFRSGTPICRVDVVTFDVQGADLRRHLNQGGSAEAVATLITDLQLAVPAPNRIEVRLTGRTEHPNPGTGGFVTRGLVSDVAIRN